MALSTRATVAALGGAVALGVLGVGGYAYAASEGPVPGVSYVTTAEEGTEGAAPSQAPEGRSGDRGDCPQKPGGSGSGSGSGEGTDSPAPSESGGTDGAADA